MQYFVLSFDSLCLLYYIYQLPVWDCVKSKFPFFQYEAKTAEKADCTNLLLTIMFNCISKVRRRRNAVSAGWHCSCSPG